MAITYPPEMLPSPDEGETGVVIVMDNEQTGDIAARLRDNAEIVPHDLYSWLNPLLIEAADEIKRLRAAADGYQEQLQSALGALSKSRAALQSIRRLGGDNDLPDAWAIVDRTLAS